jgi:predicted transglutaminase-like cysteine proteinase
MLVHFTTRDVAKWLAVILALQCPADALGMASSPAIAVQYAVPVEQHREMLASLPPVSTKQVPSSEPFGLMTVPVATGELLAKWRSVEKDIGGEVAVLARCQAQQQRPPAARKLLGIVAEGLERDGLARVGVINRAVNLAIAWTSDMTQWGVPDHWSPPLETLSTGRGDCEDYAIVKYVALLNAGFSEKDIKLVILHNLAHNEDHAVVALRVDDEWIVLDNRWLALVRDVEVRRVIPLFVIDNTGVKEFVPEVTGTKLAAVKQLPPNLSVKKG